MPVAHVVVETTGPAHPARVAELLGDDPLLRHRTALRESSSSSCADRRRQTLARIREAVDQIAAADRVVLSKTDLCEPPQLPDAVALVRAVNPSADLVAPGPLPSPPPAGLPEVAAGGRAPPCTPSRCARAARCRGRSSACG